MIQYFQLTPDILLEYVQADDLKLNNDGISGNEKDIRTDDYATMLLKSDAFSSKYLCFKNEKEGVDSISNLVLPLNNTETQFVVVKNTKNELQKFYKKTNISNRFYINDGGRYMYEDTQYDKSIIDSGKSCNVRYDKCIVHFTSRNYFGSYDSLIFQVYAYMKNKSKLYFASFLFKKTSNLKLKAEHMLYNEKLYTTQIEFEIPSIFSIVSKHNEIFIEALKNQNIELLENTPIGMNLYGVKSSLYGTDNYLRLNTLKLNSIAIPYTYNRLDEINITISEVDGGDYYYIDPDIGQGYSSFVDYIESMGEDVRAYMIMHELKLKEEWVDDNNIPQSEITHNELHIININEDDEDEEISKKFDAKIKYRPICTKSGKGYKATIIDTIKIINTIDGTSYEVVGSEDVSNPKKYGVKFKRLSDINRPIVNVYNKWTYYDKSSGSSSGSSGQSGLGSGISGIVGGGSGSGSSNGSNGDNAGKDVVVLNKSGGFIVENMTQNITSFIECTNIGVSITELSPEDVNM